MQLTDLTPRPDLTDLTLSGYDAINGSLYELFMTRLGTRPFFPDFGIGALSWLFAPLDIQYRKNYETIIRRQIKQWIPIIAVNSINITSVNGNLTITLIYVALINGLNNPQKFTTVVTR